MEETVHKRIAEKAARLENEDYTRKREVEELIARRVREERERLERDFGEQRDRMEMQTSQERDYDRKVVEMAKRERENAEE